MPQNLNTTPQEAQTRYEALKTLVKTNHNTLDEFLQLAPHHRNVGRKIDGTDITECDYTITYHSFKEITGAFPEDSFFSEECQILKGESPWCFYEDPVDATSHARMFDKDNPKFNHWATYMASYAYQEVPQSFGLGVPGQTEYYTGTAAGILRNGEAYTPKTFPEKVLLGINDYEYGDLLNSLTGYNSIPIAGLAVWLMLQGVIVGGFNIFPRVYEASCLVGAALALGATVTDQHGEAFSLKPDKWAVWSMPNQGIDHAEVMKQAQQKLGII
jgi:fructose-1,6-bisphosphatase/inositol monophosphatase family enzyme